MPSPVDVTIFHILDLQVFDRGRRSDQESIDFDARRASSSTSTLTLEARLGLNSALFITSLLHDFVSHIARPQELICTKHEQTEPVAGNHLDSSYLSLTRANYAEIIDQLFEPAALLPLPQPLTLTRNSALYHATAMNTLEQILDRGLATQST